MHTSSLAPQMETSLESKFSAAFEQQISSSGSKNLMCNGSNMKNKSGHQHQHQHQQSQQSSGASSVTTAIPGTESVNGEKTVSFRKGNDLESFESLSSLFANGLFTDLVICCPGKMFKCHRVVMAAASLYIRDALSAFYNNSPDNSGSGGSAGGGSSGCNNCNTVMILPTEIKMTDMEAILRFIYDGHVEVKVDSIESFLRSARMLNIKGLSNVNIVFNNNGTTTTTNNDDSASDSFEVISSASNNNTSATVTKNNGYSKNAILNGHTGMNSPPPSPPSLNSSLASLKAMTVNQNSSLPNGNHINNKFLNGGLSNHLINQYRNNIKSRDQSPLRNESSLLGPNITPAHQSSTPKSIYNGNLFNNNIRFDSSNSSISSSGGSRRKQKFPTNIPFITEMLPPSATALYNTWLNLNSEEDEEDDIEDNDDDKRLIIKDDSSNDCASTIGDNMSTTSMESKQPSMPFSVVPSFPPQIPCMIEVEADPTTFPTYSDYNESTTLQPSQQKRRRHFKSPFVGENRINEKRMKPFIANAGNNNSLDVVSIKPSSPLMHNSTSQQSSPSEIVPSSKKHNSNNSSGGRSSSNLPNEKPLFTAYSTVKTAAGANPSASSPSSTSSASASGSWVGSKWKCDICNKYYGNKQTLKEHMDYFHSNREEQIYICNICNKEYTWRKSLMKHYRDIHQMRNTPALAEINRQLAALASAKVRTAVASVPVPSSGAGSTGSENSNPLQSYVSIANYSSRKPGSNSQSKGSSDNSEKSNKSESEMENDNTNDAVAEEEDYAMNDDNEIDGSCTTDADLPDEMSVNDDKSESTTPEKATTKSNENSENSENTIAPDHSPTSSQASS